MTSYGAIVNGVTMFTLPPAAMLEASSVISFGLLPALDGGGVFAARKKKTAVFA